MCSLSQWNALAHGFHVLPFAIVCTSSLYLLFSFVYPASGNTTPANFRLIKMWIKVNQREFSPTSFHVFALQRIGLLKFTSAKFFSLHWIFIRFIHAKHIIPLARAHTEKKGCNSFYVALSIKISMNIFGWMKWEYVRFSVTLKRKCGAVVVAAAAVLLFKGKIKQRTRGFHTKKNIAVNICCVSILFDAKPLQKLWGIERERAHWKHNIHDAMNDIRWLFCME